ncbi:cysteine dioxygenase family protein [Elioraea sp.]|uniref:cysteine dioxygenase family protein n=1 Tax=Elioraea sp. TaxID=2185103 RepID=UPI0025C15F10|nr:cysteine dioxygenase family protein [Elioraea sp.]
MNTMLGAMVEAMTAAVEASPAQRHAAIADALAPFLGRPQLLAGIPCPCSPARYVRHLLHEDRAGGWAMVALAWAPGQASPVHGHRTWCALGIHEGWLEERYFTLSHGLPVLGTALPRAAGATSAGPADITLIHQLANVSGAPALSIHVYGVAYDGMGDGVNHVYAAA